MEPMDVLVPVVLAGTQTAAANKFRMKAPFRGEFLTATVAAATAPTGAALIYDVNIEGTTAFTTQSRRPTLDVSETEIDDSEMNTVAENGAFNLGDLITVDCDQIGSSVAGADVVIMLHLQRR